jgi:hypothetical protein
MRWGGYYIDKRMFTHEGKTALARVGINWSCIHPGNKEHMEGAPLIDKREDKITFLSWLPVKVTIDNFLEKLLENDKD